MGFHPFNGLFVIYQLKNDDTPDHISPEFQVVRVGVDSVVVNVIQYISRKSLA